MKKTIILVALASALLAGATWFRKTSSAHCESTTAQRERGRYLVEGPAHCFMCHSPLEWKRPGTPPVEGRAGGGIAPFAEEALPWLTAPNISPDPETGAGLWTDAQFARALRQGIGHDGRTLFPMMPYRLFHDLSDDDTAAVIAYVRSIPPVRHRVPPAQLPPPVAASLRPLPPPARVETPSPENPVAYGEYLTKIANCTGCHTPIGPTGEPIPGLAWAGGLNLRGPWGDVHSVNLTPDPSGIPHYTEDLFLKVIHTGNPGGKPLNPIMPVGYFRKMTDADLRAIFAYLKSLPPVSHRIDNTSPRTPCVKCGEKHGLGDMNR